MGHELVVEAVIPDHFFLRSGNPLQHATLLPIPGTAASQFDPAIFILKVDHADLNGVVRPWAAMFEVDLISEHEAACRIELQLVVIGEPMELRAACDLADGWELFTGSQSKQPTTSQAVLYVNTNTLVPYRVPRLLSAT